MILTFLGTGTSTGVPQIGCTCEVCRSADPRDHRLRCSALLETSDSCILLDCGPDFRQQMLRRGSFRRIDGVLLTHEHYDHVGGLDDLRPYSAFGDVRLFADALCAKHIRQRMPYCFVENKYPGVPQVLLSECEAGHPFQVGNVEVMPVRVMHGNLPILGYRVGRLAYLTDLKTLPNDQLPLLQGIDVLVVNALRQTPHATHQDLDEALQLSRLIGARQTYLIHMSHQIGLHAQVEAQLPEGVHLAYDGLRIEC